MGGDAFEEERILILSEMADTGPGYENILASKYRSDPNDKSNTIVRAAVAAMVLDDEGSFVRQMMIRVIGREGSFDEAGYLSLLLDSTERPYFNYSSKKLEMYGGREHASDSDDRVREAAVEAIGKIIAREAVKPGSSLVNGNLGKTLVRCALLDSSEKVRGMAAELLWNNADKIVILTLMNEFSAAEASGNLYLSVRAEDAINGAAGAFAKARVRGTALGPLIDASLENGKTGKVASDLLVRLAKMEDEVVIWIKKKRASISNGNALGDDARAGKVRRLTALIDRIGIVSGNSEIPSPPQLKGGPDVKPTRNMRPISSRREDNELIHVPGDPIGNWLRRRKYKKEQEMLKKARDIPQGTKIKK